MDRRASRAAGRRAGHARWVVALGLVVSLYVVGLVAVGVRDTMAALARASLVLVLLAVVLEAVKLCALAMVHRSSAAAVGHRVRYRDALNIALATFTLTQSLPGGGAVAGAVGVQRLTRLGLDGPIAAASVALTVTITTSTIGAVGAVAIAVAVVRGELGGAVLAVSLAFLTVLLLLVAAVLVTVRSREAGELLLSWVGRLHGRLASRVERWSASLARLRTEPPRTGRVAVVVAWAAVTWTADLIALGVVLAAFDERITVTAVVVAFAVSQLAAMIPVTPGGVGFVEGGMVGALVALGLGLADATVVVVTYRLVATWLPALVGVAPLLRPPTRYRGNGPTATDG